MEFVRLEPPPQLADSVKAVWTARGTKEEFAAPDPIVPDGCVEIIFNAGDPFMNAETCATQPRALLAGQMTKPVVALPTGGVDLIGVRFHTSRAGAALRVPMWQLQDALIDAADVNRGIGRIGDEVANLPAAERVSYVTAELTHRLHDVDQDGLGGVEQALAIIGRRRGNVSIDALARAIGVSRRHLERRFRDEVGLRVKQVARIARVHAVLALLERQSALGGAEIAAECGFSDQAHLIRECRALTGQTPVALSAPERSLSGLMREAI